MKELDEKTWRRFLRAMEAGRIVPVIGSEVFRVDSMPLMRYLLRSICEEYFIDYSDEITPDEIVDQLQVEYGNGKHEFFTALRSKVSTLTIEVPDYLKELLLLERFPLVLTTSSVPALEPYLRAQGGWSFYSYDRRGRECDEADLVSADHCYHTLYYLFGKLSSAGSYVANEEDLLSFLHYWHNESTRPVKLSQYLSDKHLLVLGCDYPDWLFRFMWSSISGSFDEVRPGQLYLSNTKARDDHELQRFLTHIKAYYKDNIRAFAEEIITRWRDYAQDNNVPQLPSRQESQQVADEPSDEIDFFISYAFEDRPKVMQIVDSLRNHGARVWFDNSCLHPGDIFPQEIRQAIVSCKRFVPILSRNTVVEGSRYYRREWSEAIEESKARLGQKYIVPIRLDDVDLKNSLIPDEFKVKIHVFDHVEAEIEKYTREIIRALRRS